MKLKKIIFSLLTVTAVGSVATTLITSCSGVSKDILNNMVSLGDDNKFADKVGDQSFDLQHEIYVALTDKSATDAFKASVVNKILKGWFDSLPNEGPVKNNKDQWTKDIKDEWNNQIQTAKNNHLSNWKYYFQNEVLNPVGGTKAKWEQNQWYSKIRDYFTTEMTKHSYLSIPTRDDSKNKDFYVKGVGDNYLSDLNHQTLDKIGNDMPTLLGSGTLGTTDTLNPDWWPTINFYATANRNYTPNSNDQDKSYALIQQMAFDLYTKNYQPLSTGYVLWNYSLGNLPDLKSIYNNEVINDNGSASTSDGDDPTSSLLSTPSFAFPFFGEPTAGSWGPNQKFAEFAKDFKSKNQFLDNRTDNTGPGKLSLIDINSNVNKYSDKSDSTLTLINRTSETTGDDTPYETYVAPIIDLLNDYSSQTSITSSSMPVAIKNNDDYFLNSNTIIKNFLFSPSQSQTTESVDPLPDVQRLLRGSKDVLDLSTIYKNDGTSAAPKIELFNPKDTTPSTGEYNWYNDSASNILTGMRFASASAGDTNQVSLPYIMIRTAKGVTFEGIDGVDYLNQAKSDQPTDDATTTWRPGDSYSQERENQIIKFRTVYQSMATTPKFKGISVIDSKNGSANGPLVDYLKSNLDDVILNTVNCVMRNKNEDVDTQADTVTKKSYYEENLLGLKSTIPGDGNDVWNATLNVLVQSFSILNAYTTAITNFDSNNKKLFSWSNTYRTNALIDINNVPGDPAPSIYKNGLATPLPIKMHTGNPSGTNMLATKTYYDPVFASAKALVKEFKLDESFPQNEYQKLIGDSDGIIENYKSWVNDSLTTTKPLDDGHGNKKAYEYNYSENILTYNDYVNDMLWKFGGSNSFSNGVKTAALKQYMADWSDGSKAQFNDAITSMYITNKLISNDTPITSYFNAKNDNTPLNFDEYKTGLLNEWNNSMSTNLGSTEITSSGEKITSGYTDKAIDYNTYLATIYRLQEHDSKLFIDWLKGQLSSGNDYQNTAYIVWAAKDNEILNADFNKPINNTDDLKAIYGWKSNYNGLFDNRYQNTNIDASSGTIKTYTNFDSYWQFAEMPYNDGADSINAMGFLGLQTKNSNTMDKVSSNAKASLFDNFGTSSEESHYGSLYQFNNDANGKNGRENLLANVNKDLETPTVDKIDKYVSFINNQTGGLFTNAGIDTKIRLASTLDEKKQILIDAISTDNILSDDCFKGYNIHTGNSKPCYELNYMGSGPVIPDDKTSDKADGSRVSIMQVNANDANVLKNGKTDYSATLAHLKLILGESTVNYLIAQAALDSINQSNTIRDVVTTVFKGGKLAVYDRRFNDQLGSTWVKDWKTKN